jgi:sigma-E factor negative regulatory protein RseA
MVQPKNQPTVQDDALSALADGQALPHEVAAACQAWRDDAQARRRWHTYHLIGDALRSQELASAPERDQAFMAALRERLADEPVVLAPAAVAPVAPARARRRLGWQGPAAVAAGFMAVAGVLTVARLPGGNPAGDAAPLAAAPQNAPVVRVGTVPLAAVPAPAVAPQASAVVVIRDPRLDRYLAAHRGLAHGLAAPQGALQQVEVLQPAAK